MAKIINLVDEKNSEIKYKISKFPDGQQNITILTKERDLFLGPRLMAVTTTVKDNVKIVSRLNNWLDLEIIVATVACLREFGVEKIHLVTPYFIGARSDRKFEEGGNWYLKDVICPIINSLKLASITVMDAHSSVLGNLLVNYKAIDNLELVNYALQNILVQGNVIKNFNQSFKEAYFEKCILVSPDAGAFHKIQKLADKIGYTGDIIICSKERDTEGKLTQTRIPLNEEENYNEDFIIIDDICDGGRTFINIVKAIKSCKPGYKGKIYLIVTHGIFSNGFEELNKYFDGIYCTNSYSDLGDFTQFKGKLEKTDLKQLNVY